MTQVITRLFESAKQAETVRWTLLSKRLPDHIVTVYTQAEGLKDTLITAHVNAETAETYANRVAQGGAVVLVKAGHRPLRVAQTARDVMSDLGAVNMGDMTEEVKVKDKPGDSGSLMAGNPLLLTRKKDPNATNFYMANWPIPLISKRKPSDEMLISRHGRMAAWPIPLTARIKPRDEYAFPRHMRMANFPLPLIWKGEKKLYTSVFPRHARMANAILPLISKRKPYTGSMIPRHHRFANWPFPHLINGKQHTNSLMPGAPRMAAGPMNLISKRKPYTGSLIPRHGRMANFPIRLLSSRKPSTASIFPRHARMANFILPLLSKNTERKSRFGFPLLSKR